MLVGICEDDASIRRVLTEVLRLSGHQVRVSHDGYEALRVLGADSAVEVIIVAIELPDSDGRDVALALRSAGQSAPVLFLTALGATDDRLSGVRSGGDDYLAEPFEIQELVARIEALGRRGDATWTPGSAPVEVLPVDRSGRDTGLSEPDLE